MNNQKTVYIVHAIDTEGPIYESLEATFERLKNILQISLEPTIENLELLRAKKIDLNGNEDRAAEFVSEKKLNYNDSWQKIDFMLEKIMSSEFRNKVKDSFGNGWIYNWFCLDLVGFKDNPRRKELGFHKVHDRYLEYIKKFKSPQDGIHFHFHPMSTYKEAHKFATSFTNSPQLHEIICRRIIERDFFPVCFRPGFHTERPDSHWFLEQWIPFDIANQATESSEEKKHLANLKGGRLGDWRGAPTNWEIYNPDFYDYRKKGSCNRFIARCLNMNARHSNLTQDEVDKAFNRANNGEATFLSFTNHDFRDMEPEILSVMEKIKVSSSKFPDVKFKFCEAKEAFQSTLFDNDTENIKLDVKLEKVNKDLKLSINTSVGNVFGPQPFLAIKTKKGRFIHDNLDFSTDGKSWSYVFDQHTVYPNDLDIVAIAANNRFGNTFISRIKNEYEI